MWGLARTSRSGASILIPASGSAEAGKVRSSWGMELPLSPSSGAVSPPVSCHEGHGGHSKEQNSI